MGRDRAPLGRLTPAEADLGPSAGQVVPGGPQGSPEVPGGPRRLPEASRGPRVPGGSRRRPGGGSGGEGGGEAEFRKSFSKQTAQFTKLAACGESNTKPNLLNPKTCLLNLVFVWNFLLNSAPRAPPGASGPPGASMEASGNLLHGTSGDLRGPLGTSGDHLPKSASAGARRPKGALSRPKRAPVLPNIYDHPTMVLW